MTMSDNNPDLLTMAAKYQALVYQADAFFFTQEYKKAEVCRAGCGNEAVSALRITVLSDLHWFFP